MNLKLNIALVVIPTLLAAGCTRKPVPTVAATSPQITIVKPERRSIARVVEQPGTIQAFEETSLFAKITGYVGAIAGDPNKKDRPPHDRQIDIGSRVNKDQVLIHLSVPELDREYAQKDALIKQAESEVVQSNKALAAAKEGVEAASAQAIEAKEGELRAEALHDRWQGEFKRISTLVKEGVIDAGTRDETENQFKAAQSSRKEAKARTTAARATVNKMEAERDKAAADTVTVLARVEVARANLAQVDAMRTYITIKAPFDGIVTQRGVNTGDLVSATEKVSLFRVARIDPVRVVVRVPEADAGLVVVGQEVRIALQAPQGPTETGKVARTSWSLEPGSRTLRTEIDLPNARGVVRPGTYVSAKLMAELPAAWTLPAAAIGKVNDEPVIYLVEGGKAMRVRVELLRGDSQFTQVRRYKKPGATDWSDVTGTESLAMPASALSDGQSVP